MNDQWKTPNGDPIANDWAPGLPPNGEWQDGCGCEPPSGMASVEGITITGVPGTISSLYWQVALNDGAEPPNYAVNHLDGQGGVVSTPMTISGLDSTVEFNEPVMLSRDPIEDLEAATKQYVDDNATGIPDAPAVNWYYGRFNEAWATIPIQSDAPSDGQAYVRQNQAWSLAFTGSGYLPLIGGTISGNLTVNGVMTVSGPNSLALSAPAGNQRAILGQTGTLSRWQLQLGDQIAEGVGNAGSNFSLTAYTNLGGFLGTWLSISRADGTAAFAGHVNISQGLAVNGLLAVNDITNFYVPGGTAGQVMTTNGTGGLSWTTPSGGGGPSGPPVTIGDTPPSSPAVGALWWDSVGGQLYVWYTDANSSQWVPATNTQGAQGIQGPTGATGPAGPAGPNTLPPGVTDGSDAAAGQIGQIISSIVQGSSAVTLTNGTAAVVASIALPAGDWDICGEAWISGSSGSGTSHTGAFAAINTIASLPGATSLAINTARTGMLFSGTVTNANFITYPMSCRYSGGAVTYNLLVQLNFSANSGFGFGKLWARRAR